MASSQPPEREEHQQQLTLARRLREMWQHKTGEQLPPAWDAAFVSWINIFGFPLVADAIQAVAASANRGEGEHRRPDVRNVPRYAAVEQADEAELGVGACYKIRGRMRKKFYGGDEDSTIIALLIEAMRRGVSASAMHEAVDDNETLEDCFAALGVDRTVFRVAMGHPIVDRSPLQHIRADSPEGRLWDAYQRRTTGIGPPMDKNFGWHFPTREPPAEPPKGRSRSRTT